ncbi:MAG: hypothetical protein H0W78_04095 [Planctomycetes bacterium]|nr:hypothetical protein [Planctomycetota bacterium]
MVAFDLTTVVRDGVIHVDPALNGRQVRVVVLTDDGPLTKESRQLVLERMFAHRSKVDGFLPLSRDEANSRT